MVFSSRRKWNSRLLDSAASPKRNDGRNKPRKTNKWQKSSKSQKPSRRSTEVRNDYEASRSISYNDDYRDDFSDASDATSARYYDDRSRAESLYSEDASSAFWSRDASSVFLSRDGSSYYDDGMSRGMASSCYSRDASTFQDDTSIDGISVDDEGNKPAEKNKTEENKSGNKTKTEEKNSDRNDLLNIFSFVSEAGQEVELESCADTATIYTEEYTNNSSDPTVGTYNNTDIESALATPATKPSDTSLTNGSSQKEKGNTENSRPNRNFFKKKPLKGILNKSRSTKSTRHPVQFKSDLTQTRPITPVKLLDDSGNDNKNITMIQAYISQRGMQASKSANQVSPTHLNTGTRSAPTPVSYNRSSSFRRAFESSPKNRMSPRKKSYQGNQFDDKLSPKTRNASNRRKGPIDADRARGPIDADDVTARRDYKCGSALSILAEGMCASSCFDACNDKEYSTLGSNSSGALKKSSGPLSGFRKYFAENYTEELPTSHPDSSTEYSPESEPTEMDFTEMVFQRTGIISVGTDAIDTDVQSVNSKGVNSLVDDDSVNPDTPHHVACNEDKKVQSMKPRSFLSSLKKRMKRKGHPDLVDPIIGSPAFMADVMKEIELEDEIKVEEDDDSSLPDGFEDLLMNMIAEEAVLGCLNDEKQNGLHDV